jgi:competence protein ComGD
MKLTEEGYTLIEALCVLSIFLIISSVAAFSIKPQYERMESEMFLNQLQSDLLYGQQYAISHQQEVTVFIFPEEHYYFLRNTYIWPPFLLRYYSNAVSVSPGSLPLTFKFTPSGIVNKFGSLLIHSGNKHYRLTVLIGKGRFYVVEE